MGAANNDKLIFDDSQHRETFLTRLNTLRKGGQFCDVTLQIDSREIKAHRVVLASSSKHLLELFSTEMEKENHLRPIIKLHNVDFDAFNTLVKYAYTSRLAVEADKVKAVYKTAMQLKMPAAAEACSRYLADHLSPNNCLGIRGFANSYDDGSLTSKTDSYIQQNIEDVANCKKIASLPRIQVDIIGVEDKQLSRVGIERHFCQLLVDWAKTTLPEDAEDTLPLTDHVHVLYVTQDNTLCDVASIEDPDNLNDAEIIQDYKKASKKRKSAIPKSPSLTQITFNGDGSKNKQDNAKQNGGGGGGGQAKNGTSPKNLTRTDSLDSLDEISLNSEEKEWKLIATRMSDVRQYMCVAMLADQLVTMSVHLVQSPSAHGSKANSPLGSPKMSRSCSMEKQLSFTPLAPMSSARCGVGVAVISGKLVAMGGYDRGECLNTVEMYDMQQNSWTPMPIMRTPRGRFDVTQLNGAMYACGGSDGQKELDSAEVFDPAVGKWKWIDRLPSSRSSSGVAALNDHLYIVGGWNGMGGMSEVARFDPKTGKWSKVAPLHVRRSQTAVCAYKGSVYAIGGCDAWHCINSVEVYQPEEDRWTMMAPLNTNRRGCGVAVFKDKLYAVGGSDGTASLATVEVYDPETKKWIFGRSLSTPRANVAVAVVNDMLFAVGGFDGKSFLSSVEYLDPETFEWVSYLPLEEISKITIEEAPETERTTKKENGDVNMNGKGENVIAHLNGDMNGAIFHIGDVPLN